MKNIFLFLFALNFPLLFAQSINITDYYEVLEIKKEEIQPASCGWLEHNLLPKNCDECYIMEFKNKKLKGIKCIKYYQENSGARKTHIEIGTQHFEFDGKLFFHETINFSLVEYKGAKYLIMTGNVQSTSVHDLFIFDITNSKKIKMTSLPDTQNYFYSDNSGKGFFGFFNNTFCFFFRKETAQHSGEYYIAPYYIENNLLKELQSNDGKFFRVFYEAYKSDANYIVNFLCKTF